MAELTKRPKIVVDLPADRVAVTEGQILQASWWAKDPTVVTVSLARQRKGIDPRPIEVWNGELIEVDFFPVVNGVIQRDLVEDAVREHVEGAQQGQEDPVNWRRDYEIDVSGGWAAWYVGDWLMDTPVDEWPRSGAEAVELAARDNVLLINDFQEELESRRRAEGVDGDDDD